MTFTVAESFLANVVFGFAFALGWWLWNVVVSLIKSLINRA